MLLIVPVLPCRQALVPALKGMPERLLALLHCRWPGAACWTHSSLQAPGLCPPCQPACIPVFMLGCLQRPGSTVLTLCAAALSLDSLQHAGGILVPLGKSPLAASMHLRHWLLKPGAGCWLHRRWTAAACRMQTSSPAPQDRTLVVTSTMHSAMLRAPSIEASSGSPR